MLVASWRGEVVWIHVVWPFTQLEATVTYLHGTYISMYWTVIIMVFDTGTLVIVSNCYVMLKCSDCDHWFLVLTTDLWREHLVTGELKQITTNCHFALSWSSRWWLSCVKVLWGSGDVSSTCVCLCNSMPYLLLMYWLILDCTRATKHQFSHCAYEFSIYLYFVTRQLFKDAY